LPLKESTLKEIKGILYKRINARFKNNFSGNFWVPPQILCELVFTIPATSAADELSFSVLEIRKLFKKFAEPGQVITGFEKHSKILPKQTTVQTQASRVIDLFAKKNRRLELNYKINNKVSVNYMQLMFYTRFLLNENS
jgi:hypothetical protein